MVAAVLACAALPAVAARPGAVAPSSRGTVTITASVAGQAQVRGDADTLCLWSNTATRLIDVTIADAAHRTAADRAATPCAQPGAARVRLIVATAPDADPRSILVSPQ